MHLMGIEHGGGFLNYFSVTTPIWNRLMYDFYVSQGFDPLVHQLGRLRDKHGLCALFKCSFRVGIRNS